MSVVLVRIDDRLIHGQVAASWSKVYEIEQIIVINDKVKTDELMKSLLVMAAPPNVKVIIFSVEEFIDIINKKVPIKRRTLLLTSGPNELMKIIESGYQDITSINIGGMQFNEGRKRLSKAVSVSKEEDLTIKRILENNIDVYVQMVPTDKKTKYLELAREENNVC